MINVFRLNYIFISVICFPLFIWLWGSIANTVAMESVVFIKQSLLVFYSLQMTAVLISTPFQQRSLLISQYLQSALLWVLIPLPFISIAWMAAAISFIGLIKMLLIVFFAGLLMAIVTRVLFYLQGSLRVDILIAIVLSIWIWSHQDQWQMWMN